MEAGSINEAAKKMYIAHSSLSNAMKALENELGAPLFCRTNKGVRLTPYGANVYRQASRICSGVDSLKETAKARANRHLVVSSLYCSLAKEAFAKFYEQHYKERLSATIEECSLSNIMRNVSGGLAEVGILTMFPSNRKTVLWDLENYELEYTMVLQRALYVILGPKNPLYNRDSVSLEELRPYPNIGNYASSADFPWEENFRSLDGFRSNILVTDMGLALQIVSKTDGFTIDTFDNEAYTSVHAQPECRFIPLTDSCVRAELGWVKSIYRELTPTAKDFMTTFTELAQRSGIDEPLRKDALLLGNQNN